jgi:hypothetical protein
MREVLPNMKWKVFISLFAARVQAQAQPSQASTTEIPQIHTNWSHLLRIGGLKATAAAKAEKPPEVQAQFVYHCPIPLPHWHPVDCWMSAHPKVANQLVWWKVIPTFPLEMKAVAWPDWDEGDKEQFRRAYDAYEAWHLNNMGPFGGEEFADIIPNRLSLKDDQDPQLNMDYATAWLIFRSYTAFSLAAEINRWYPWSIEPYSDEELADLFLAKEFGLDAANAPDYFAGFTLGGYDVTPAPPSAAMNLLKDENLVKSSPRETAGAVLRYMRDFSHYLDGKSTLAMQNTWGYPGPPPMIRILKKTRVQGQWASMFPEPRHWIHGCRGSTSFQIWMGRLFNIPVRAHGICGHEVPYYPTLASYLSHGDDPYSLFSLAPPDYDGKELLVGRDTFQSWFPNQTDDDNDPECVNIGRRTEELAVKHLPDTLLDLYCHDVALGLSHLEGSVFLNLQESYTMAELIDRDLWKHLDDKAKAEGKCSEGKTFLPLRPPDEIPLRFPGSAP